MTACLPGTLTIWGEYGAWECTPPFLPGGGGDFVSRSTVGLTRASMCVMGLLI